MMKQHLKELFIVEGKSAASTLQQLIDKQNQEVFAVQGKMLNVDKAPEQKVFQDETCQSLFNLLGCGIGEKCDPDKLMYSRIFILTDPDIDGVHARILLLKLFNKFLHAVIDAGMLWVIVPPLFRLTSLNWDTHQYAWNRTEYDQIIKQYPSDKIHIMQYKGVAQFSPQEQAVLLHPQTRKQFRISASDG